MLNQLSQTPASGLLAAAAGSGENTVVLIAIGVGILFLVLFFVLSRKKQADAIAEEERLRKAKQIRPEELEERKDELSLAELKKAKKSTLGEEQTKEERREMRRKRRAKAQTEKAQSEREVDEGDEEDEELEDDEQLEEPVLVRKAKVEEEPLSDAEAAEIEREKELGKLLDDAVDEKKEERAPLGLDFDDAVSSAKQLLESANIPPLGSGLISLKDMKAQPLPAMGGLDDLELKSDDEERQDEEEQEARESIEKVERTEKKAEKTEKTEKKAGKAGKTEKKAEKTEKKAEKTEKTEKKAEKAEPTGDDEREERRRRRREKREEEKGGDEESSRARRSSRRAKAEEAAQQGPRTLREGLDKTRTAGFVAKLGHLLGGKLDDDVVEELEEILFTADIGVQTSRSLLDKVEKTLSRKELKDGKKALEFLRSEMQEILEKSESRFVVGPEAPHVVLVVGVNGAGKTTTIGKIAAKLMKSGKKVLMIAGDTFRAAAIEQLQEWGARTDCPVHASTQGSDPSAVLFDGLERAKKEGFDVVLADTAGRLHNKKDLVEELKKIHRVAAKCVPNAPHQTLLVLDATNGQNALAQAVEFKEAVDYTGIILTKLDGTAKGGVIIGICDELKMPVHFIGIGETVDDLRDFNAGEFVDALF